MKLARNIGSSSKIINRLISSVLFSTKSKDKTASKDLKIFLNHVGKVSNEDQDEEETFLPRKNINLKLKHGTKP